MLNGSKPIAIPKSYIDEVIIEINTTLTDSQIEDIFKVSDTTLSVKHVSDDAGYKIYAVVDTAVAASDTATVSMDVVIPAEWDNDEMEAFNGLTVHVTAYATQTVGFQNAAEALTTAFPTEWAAYNSNP